jgi:Polyketide cyclase / dehydrase and lipid transport
VSDTRQQAYIEAPISVIWELIADVERHADWWPRVVETQCDELGEGCTYREVVKTPMGEDEMHLMIEAFDGQEFKIRCLNTGTFVHFGLTEAQGGTFVDGRMGMDPGGLAHRVFDTVAGRMYFRRWLAASLDAMDEAAKSHAEAAHQPTE